MHYIGASFRLRLWFLPADDASFPLRLTPKILPLPPPLADDALPRAPRPLPLADDTPPRPPPCPLPLADNTPPRAPPPQCFLIPCQLIRQVFTIKCIHNIGCVT
eukprot:444599_1